MSTGKLYVWGSRIFLLNLALAIVRGVRDVGVSAAAATTRGAAGAVAGKGGGA